MVPRTQSNRSQRPDDIRYNIIKIKGSAIVDEALEELRAYSENACAYDQREVETPSPRGVEDPVEASCEDEEGQEMENFVVDPSIDLERGKSGIGCGCDEEEEGAYMMSVRASEGRGRGCRMSAPAKGSLIRIFGKRISSCRGGISSPQASLLDRRLVDRVGSYDVK